MNAAGDLAGLGLERSVIERAQLLAARTHQSLFITLSEMGELTDEVLSKHLAEQTGLDVQAELPPSPEEAFPVSSDFLQHHRICPLKYDDQDGWLVGLVDPSHDLSLSALRFALGDVPVRYVILPHEVFKRHSAAHRKNSEMPPEHDERDIDEQLALLSDQDRNAPVVQFLSSWLRKAVSEQASDIHFETRKNELLVRLRLDGVLTDVAHEGRELAGPLLARIRVIAGLDLDSRARPQDGRAQIVVAGRAIDLRISLVPSSEGGSAVIRLLDRPDALLSLEGLGFGEGHRSVISTALEAKDGLILFCGPTGSGKTTSLYACLELMKSRGLKVLSAEDPIEYRFDHVTQVAVSEERGNDFPTLLRAFLRHDPDVMMIGEIRDRETASIALQAALTGHLVLASLHAMDVRCATHRLVQLGLESDQIEACLRLTIAQRLVRRLCHHCKAPRALRPSEVNIFTRANIQPPESVYDAIGCVRCGRSGYRGRMVVAQSSSDTIPLSSDALVKVGFGEISIEDLHALSLDSALTSDRGLQP
jgi:general secretion pathway protein E